jgi:hypothetical protein
MADNHEFNLEEILEESTKKLKEKYPEAQAHLILLSNDKLQIRLTSSQAQDIALTLLEKIGHKVNSL